MSTALSSGNEQSIGSAISDIALIADCMAEAEIREKGVVFLPLRDR
jgi:hypothetical protein